MVMPVISSGATGAPTTPEDGTGGDGGLASSPALSDSRKLGCSD
tara:strand:+ start:860 stop:991 length:132 start_codon:yes stop_codon:yes gene_type:complete